MSKFIKIIDNQSLCMQPLIEKVIKKLCTLPNGGDCTMIYLKILELAIDNNGTLYFHKLANTFEEELSLILSENVENIKNVLSVLFEMDLISENAPHIFIISDFEKFSDDLRKKFKNSYMRNYRKQKRSNNSVTTSVITPVTTPVTTSVITPSKNTPTNIRNSQQQPTQPSDTAAISKKETAQNEQVSTNTRAYIDINNNYNKDLSKDLNIKLKDKQDINNKYLELENKDLKTKDLKTKSLNNKNLKTKKLNNKNLKPKESLTVSKDSNNSSVDLQAITKQVIEHINCVSHANYRNLKQYRDLIQECLNDGYTPQDFITAIDKKAADLTSSPDRKFWLNKCIKPTWILKPVNLDQCLNLRVVPKVDKCTYDCLKRRSDVRKVLDKIDVQFDPDDNNKRDIIDDFDDFFDIKFDEERVCA